MSLSLGLTFSVFQYQARDEEQEQEAEREAICTKTPRRCRDTMHNQLYNVSSSLRTESSGGVGFGYASVFMHMEWLND